MKKTLLSLTLLISWPAIMCAQSGHEFDIKAVAKDTEQRFRACPRREIVAQLERKHQKKVWQKQGWGPPSDVFADVKLSDSMLYPYILTVEYNLSYGFGPERESKADAERDTNLSQKPALTALFTIKNRNIYLVSKDGIRLKTREVLDKKLFDDIPGQWVERRSWPDACWDQIAVK